MASASARVTCLIALVHFSIPSHFSLEWKRVAPLPVQIHTVSLGCTESMATRFASSSLEHAQATNNSTIPNTIFLPVFILLYFKQRWGSLGSTVEIIDLSLIPSLGLDCCLCGRNGHLNSNTLSVRWKLPIRCFLLFLCPDWLRRRGRYNPPSPCIPDGTGSGCCGL